MVFNEIWVLRLLYLTSNHWLMLIDPADIGLLILILLNVLLLLDLLWILLLLWLIHLLWYYRLLHF